MKQAIIGIMGLLITLGSTSSQAANVWTERFTVGSVLTVTSLGFAMRPTGTLAGGCTVLRVYVGRNGQDVASAKNALAVALSASLVNKEIRVLYDNASTSCYVRYVELFTE